MATNKRVFTLRLSDEVFDKIGALATREHRSITLPIYADQLGWAIPEEYTEIFADLVIVGAVLMVSCKYIAEAFTKFRAILQVKGDTENE